MTDVLTFPTTSTPTTAVSMIGLAERSRCLEELTDNLAKGVLRQSEFDQRAQHALIAETDRELQELTNDLS